MNKFIMMIGLPASGKDTWIEQFLKASDEKWTVVTPEQRLKPAIMRGDNIIYNDANTTVKDRQPALELVKTQKDYMIYGIIIATTLPQCYQNNRKREPQVPQSIIKDMYYHYEPPHYFEGFNKIEVVYPFIKPYIYYKDKIKDLKKISHDNPWHDFSIGTHINVAVKLWKKDKNKTIFFNKDYPLEDYYKDVVEKALMLHDIGKEKTKTFTDLKGNPTKEAHYYYHANVGAYDYMFYTLEHDYYDPLHPEFDPNIAAAIAYHMRPFDWKDEKIKEKYKKLWGDKLFRIVELINIYDERAEKN